MSKHIKIIFTLSVLLNIIFIGVGAGLFYRFCQQDSFPVTSEMSPEARSFIARTFQDGREKVKPLIEEVKVKRARVEDVITADQFDPKAYDKSVSDMLDTRDKISRKRAEIMGQALVDLPAADREHFAKRILDGLEGRGPHKRGGGPSSKDKGAEQPGLKDKTP